MHGRSASQCSSIDLDGVVLTKCPSTEDTMSHAKAVVTLHLSVEAPQTV